MATSTLLSTTAGDRDISGCKISIVRNDCVDKRVKPRVLLLLLHGVHGTIDDFRRLVPAVCRKFAHRDGSPLFIVQTTCNQCKSVQLLFSKTKEGIVACAKRVVDVVDRLLRTHPEATNLERLILLGHSFGGIYGRYAAKLFVDRKIVPQVLKPVQYISVASPHIGVRRRAGAFFTAYRFLAPALAGQCGRELLLEDEAKIMSRLADGPFLAALAMFEGRTCYGNIFHDVNVPLCTATMRARNPYRDDEIDKGVDGDRNEKKKKRGREKYPGIVGTSIVFSAAEDDSKCQHPFANDVHGDVIRKMRANLLKLGWERIDCKLSGRMGWCHVQIIGQQAGGEGVQDHIADLIHRVATNASKQKREKRERGESTEETEGVEVGETDAKVTESDAAV